MMMVHAPPPPPPPPRMGETPAATGQLVSWTLEGVDPRCAKGPLADVSKSCGVHIEAGGCSDPYRKGDIYDTQEVFSGRAMVCGAKGGLVGSVHPRVRSEWLSLLVSFGFRPGCDREGVSTVIDAPFE